MKSIIRIGAAALVGGALLAASGPALAQAGAPTGTWLS